MKKQFLILIFILMSVIFISTDLFARRSGGRSGGRSFSSRRSSPSYSRSSSRSRSYSRSSYSGTKRKGLGYYDPTANNYTRTGVYIEDDGTDFLLYIIIVIISIIIWFIYQIAGGKEFISRLLNNLFNKMDEAMPMNAQVISFRLLISLDFDLIEKIYFFNEGNNVRIHKILEVLAENTDKILKYETPSQWPEMKYEKVEKKVNEFKKKYINSILNDSQGDAYLVSIIAAYKLKLNIPKRENYSPEEFNEMLKELLKLNKYIISDNVKYSDVIIYKVKSDFSI